MCVLLSFFDEDEGTAAAEPPLFRDTFGDIRPATFRCAYDVLQMYYCLHDVCEKENCFISHFEVTCPFALDCAWRDAAID